MAEYISSFVTGFEAAIGVAMTRSLPIVKDTILTITAYAYI